MTNEFLLLFGQLAPAPFGQCVLSLRGCSILVEPFFVAAKVIN